MSDKAAFTALPTPVAILDLDLNIRDYNSAFAEKHTESLIGRPLVTIFPIADKEAVSSSLARVLADSIVDAVAATSSSAGTALSGRVEAFIHIPLFDEEGGLDSVVHCQLRRKSFTHAEEQADAPLQLIQEAIDAERERIRLLFKQAPGFICLLRGPQHVFELANDAYNQLIGHREVLGHPLAEVLPEVIAQGFLDKLDRVYATGQPFIGRAIPIKLQRSIGSEMEQRFIDLTYQPMRDQDGEVTGIFVQGHDVTEAHELATEVRYQAAHDPLTALLNRREFARRVGDIDLQAHHALVYVDLDHFKIVNDRSGHLAGDALLVQVARTLKEACAESDILARLGGDEFALVRCNCSLNEAIQLAEELRQAIKKVQFVWQGKRYSITISAGIAAFGGAEGLTFEAALGLADAACFLAKEKGRNRAQVSLLADDEVRQQQTDMDGATRLKDALREDRLVLYGQKIVPLNPYEADRTSCLEVLARIVDYDGSILGPGAFIPAAERFGLIQEVDHHIIAKAFALLHALRPDVRQRTCVFINLSGITLSSSDFSVFIDSLMQALPNVSPSQVCFEITETAAISNISKTGEAMRRMIEKGYSFALDDFGSGMASFAYLRHLPAQYVKIDGEFVKRILSDATGSAIVEAVAKVAKTMDMKTIAESVEFDSLLPPLRELGLDYVQGYALHRPEPLAHALMRGVAATAI